MEKSGYMTKLVFDIFLRKLNFNDYSRNVAETKPFEISSWPPKIAIMVIMNEKETEQLHL